MDSARRRWLRSGLAALAAQMFVLGGPAALAPRWFFDWFPVGRSWVGSTGPYHEHLVLDLGYAYLGLALVLTWAAIRLDRELCLAATLGATATNTAHLFFHARHLHDLPAGDTLVQDGLLTLAVVVGVAVAALTPRRGEHPR